MSHARRQQKRQTAGTFVGNLFKGGGGNGGGRKKNSTAQPRPEILVPPRGIGPVHELNVNDVLCGRGGRINAHPGNVQFREMVQLRKKDYLAKSTKKLEKAHIAADVIHKIRGLNPSGRFLKEEKDGAWYDIGDQKAIKKVGQALREDAPEVRQELDGSDEDGPDTPRNVASSSPSSKQAKSPSPSKQIASKPTVEISLPQQNEKTYETIASQEIGPPSYPSMPPPQAHFNQGGQQFNSLLPNILPSAGAGVSSAAAAAFEEEGDNFDMAFGKSFHPPLGVETQREVSQISGLSGPASDVMSGISYLSEKSAQPVRSTHHHYYPSSTHVPHYRQPGQSSLTPSDLTGTRHLLSGSAHLGSSLGRSNSLTDLNAMDNASIADHSLRGGGIRDSSQLAVGSISGMQSVTMSSDMDRGSMRSSRPPPMPRGERLPYHHHYHHHHHQQQQQHYPNVAGTSDLASVTSMSIGESIFSGLSLSESLNALDLADSSIH